MSKDKTFLLLTLTLLSISLTTSAFPVNLAMAQETLMFVDPANIVDVDLEPSSDFTITINVSDVPSLYTWQIKLTFDPSIINCTAAYYPPGHVFDGMGPIPVEPTIDNVVGYVLHGASLIVAPIDVETGVLCAIDFHVLDRGSCDLTLDTADSFLLNFDLQDIPMEIQDGFFDNRIEEELHDVAVVDVVPSSGSVTVGDSVTVTVSVENQGDFAETFDVTAYYDGNLIDTASGISLDSGASQDIPFTWDTTGVAIGSYTLSAEASVVEGEVDTVDNVFEDGQVEVVEAPPPHDVAVVDVVPSVGTVTVGDSLTIDVTVQNQGTEAETFDVTVYYDDTVIDSTSTSLNPSESDVVSFTWDTTGIAVGTYTIGANASVVEGEVDTADNTFEDGQVELVEELHDVAVVDVVPSSGSVTVGDSVTVTVSVENQGDFAETFDVTAYYDGNLIDTASGISLDSGTSDDLPFVWDTTGVVVGSYTLSAEASVVEGEVDTVDNTFEDGQVEITEEPPPPPPEGPVTVDWADYPTKEYPCGDPQYPGFGGQYHTGEYPAWKNFTVMNNHEKENIVYVAIQYPEGFQPSKYMISVISSDDSCWTVNVNLVDRHIEYFADGEGIPPGGCAIVSVQYKDGPTEENCHGGHEFHVTASFESCAAYTFQPHEYIDKTPPNVDVTFPDAESPGGQGYAFVKKEDGYIWVQTPDCTVRNIGWLWINGTASDSCSGVNRVEIWINGTYMGDATLSESIGPGKARDVTWSWYTDPTNNPQFWQSESWYHVVARAYDNSVKNAEAVKHDNLIIPKTNSEDTPQNWFFWIGTEQKVHVMLDHEHIDWTPGNGRIDVWGETGFYPNGEVEIWLENELYGIEIHLKTVTADNYGRFYTIIHHLPEVPRKPTCDDHWFVRAVDEKGNKGADHFAIIPWITYEDTMAQDDPETWQTTKKGYVDDTFIVYGHGFLPSRQDNWDPYCTVYVRIYYCGVAPRVYDQISQKRRVFNGTSQFNWDNLEWYPRLSETVLAEVQTDENGYWQAEIKIPQSYGGLHAIYACEYRIVADPARTCPNGELDLVCSGWPQCTEIEKEAQSVIFDVWPTIKVSPSTALTNQYVTVEGEGLPLPRYYQLWMNGESIVEDRDWCLVLDFGPYKQWIFENKRIRNNELDLAWVDEIWYPFSFYTPDIGAFLESPVWKGKLTSITKDYTKECTESYQFHIGSKYLQVPVLPADSYEVMIYYYDKNSQKFIHDHHAITSIEVLKDPLNVHMEVGGIHFPEETVDVTVHVDVDGIDTDVTSLVFALYKGESFFENLNYDRISTGFYVATFNCPAGEGDYFIKASVAKEYESFTLYGSAITSFTVSPTLNGLNAKLLALEGELATLITDMGEMKVNLSRINARIEAVSGDIVTIETSIGTLQTDISNINGKLVGIEGTIVTINTDIGILKENAKDLNAKIISIHNNTVDIYTKMGYLNASLNDINGIVHIENDLATIKTDLGEIRGKVLSLEGNVAIVKSDIGQITAKADSIKSDIGLQPVTIGSSIIAAIAAIATAALILKKVYLK